MSLAEPDDVFRHMTPRALTNWRNRLLRQQSPSEETMATLGAIQRELTHKKREQSHGYGR